MSDVGKIRQLPCWRGPIEVAALGGGLSNANYVVTDAAGRHVVRFGRDYPFHHVDRAREVMVARAAHAAGFAPAVEHAEPGVMVTQFLGARTFAAADVAANAARIGTLLRAFHTSVAPRITGPGYIFWVFHVIRDYAHTLQQAHSPHVARLPGFLEEARALEAMQVPLPIVFGHHDLLPANILDDGTKLWLIDFEYAGFGTAMFDLAGASSNAQMNPDAQQQLLRAYLGQAPDAAFMRAFAAMECASLLRETLWAMVSSLFLAAPGVDYEAYGRENLLRYETALESCQSRYGRFAP